MPNIKQFIPDPDEEKTVKDRIEAYRKGFTSLTPRLVRHPFDPPSIEDLEKKKSDYKLNKRLDNIEKNLKQIERYLQTIFGSPPHYLIKGKWVSLEDILNKKE